jgi:hypothetical protein
MSRDPAQRHWEKAVRALAWRVNIAAWLERAAPGFFGLGTAAGFTAYVLRRMRLGATDEGGEALSGGVSVWAWWGLGLVAGVLVLGAWAWRRARGHFFKTSDACALLEHHAGLNSSLSAAAAGVTRWPAPRAVPAAVRWQARGPAAWLAGAVALGLAGLLAPVPARERPDYVRVAEKPPALAEAEAWLEQLAEREVARPEDVEKLAEQARGLGERTPEERYSHSALEAADTLRAQTAQAIRGLGANLEEAAAALAALERPAEQLSDEELGEVAARLGEALRGLQDGPLAAREELMSKLGAAANAAGRRSLSPEQAKELRQQLAKAGRAATGVVGAQGQGAGVATADPDRPVKLGSGKCSGGTCSGACGGECEGEGMGSGAVARGPGHAPLMFNEEMSDAGAGRTETVSAEDLSRAALGELLGMERGEHEFDPKQSAGPTAAGAVSAPAEGGEVVWVGRYTPQERAALKEFFK